MGHNIEPSRYDTRNLGFKCAASNGCQWRVYCYIAGKTYKWQVSLFKQMHTCILNGKCEMLKAPVIARLFVDKIREDPEYMMPMKIGEIIKERWKIIVSRSISPDARLKALKWIDKEYEEQYARLIDYGDEILDANPGSSVEIDTMTNELGDDVFNRFYMCFDILRRTWNETCRPLIGVDGCFLKEKMKGQFLVALGRDTDNGIYPIAWAVVQVENIDN